MLRFSSSSDSNIDGAYEIDLITTENEKQEGQQNNNDNGVIKNKKQPCRPKAKMELLTWVPFEITTALLSNGNMNGIGILTVPRNLTITTTTAVATTIPFSPIKTSTMFEKLEDETIPITNIIPTTTTTTATLSSSSLSSHDEDNDDLISQQNQRKRKRSLSSSSFSS
ncbi:hypothetical protein BDC45DRAFT_316342 [Circinella umbellata]|nr:hypothetical protein BDC45DRAFT_316342 [Circinella umbellata]